MASTASGWQYAVPNDTLVAWPAVSQAVADKLEARLPGGATAGIVPFATAAGQPNAVFTASSTSVQSVTFPAGRFTQAPLVVLTANSAAGNFSGSTYRATSITTTSFNLLGTATSVITNTTGVSYIAIQMTSAAAAG